MDLAANSSVVSKDIYSNTEQTHDHVCRLVVSGPAADRIDRSPVAVVHRARHDDAAVDRCPIRSGPVGDRSTQEAAVRPIRWALAADYPNRPAHQAVADRPTGSNHRALVAAGRSILVVADHRSPVADPTDHFVVVGLVAAVAVDHSCFVSIDYFGLLVVAIGFGFVGLLVVGAIVDSDCSDYLSHLVAVVGSVVLVVVVAAVVVGSSSAAVHN